MKNTIIRINSIEESEKVQNRLFSMGINWVVAGKKLQFKKHEFLIIDAENSFKMAISCRRKMPEGIQFSVYHDYIQIDAKDFLGA